MAKPYSRHKFSTKPRYARSFSLVDSHKKTDSDQINRVNNPVAIWETLARQEFSKPPEVLRVQMYGEYVATHT